LNALASAADQSVIVCLQEARRQMIKAQFAVTRHGN
jgi:hypothetical protein